MATDISLPNLFARALGAASKAHNLATIQDDTQALIRSAISDLNSLYSRISTLSLFSSNEALEDVSTRDLVYLFVPFITAELEGRIRTIESEERMIHLGIGQRYWRAFVESLDSYDIVPAAERELYEKRTSEIRDPAKRRELKIRQYQQGKELRTRIEVIRKRRGQRQISNNDMNDFDLISSLLPSSSALADDDEEEDSETDDILRETTLLLLRLTYAQAYGQLESLNQELELLRSAPPPPPSTQHPPEGRKGKHKDEENDMWKLDASTRSDGSGPLLDASGKPLRPFTILPAGTSDRSRLQSQVFGPGHRLPTMSVDEYLQIEREQGNILSGGGPQSEQDPTSSEQLAIDAEQDGTIFGEEKAEQKRLKDENWARYTDVNPKGAGNTMNRG